MLRPTLRRLYSSLPIPTLRTFSTSARAMAVGDTGSGFSRPQGERAGDTWTRREHASEEMWIRNEERNRLLALKERMERREEHAREMEKHIEEAIKAKDLPEADMWKLHDLKAKHEKATEAQSEVKRHIDEILSSSEGASKAGSEK